MMNKNAPTVAKKERLRPKDLPALRRQSMTVSLSDRAQTDLDVVTAAFVSLSESLPGFFTVPRTKAAVAAWLVGHHAPDVNRICKALFIERQRYFNELDEEGFKVRVKADLGSVSDSEGLDTYQRLIKSIDNDPYFQGVRNMLRVPKE